MRNLKVKFLLRPVINVMQLMRPAVPNRFPTPAIDKDALFVYVMYGCWKSSGLGDPKILERRNSFLLNSEGSLKTLRCRFLAMTGELHLLVQCQVLYDCRH